MKVVYAVVRFAYKDGRSIRYYDCTLKCGHGKASRLGVKKAPLRLKCENGCEEKKR